MGGSRRATRRERSRDEGAVRYINTLTVMEETELQQKGVVQKSNKSRTERSKGRL